jgi:hypothetical protein
VLSLGTAGVSSIFDFHRPDLFPWFGLPVERSEYMHKQCVI